MSTGPRDPESLAACNRTWSCHRCGHPAADRDTCPACGGARSPYRCPAGNSAGDLREADTLRSLTPGQREDVACAVRDLVAAAKALAWYASIHTPNGACLPCPTGYAAHLDPETGAPDWQAVAALAMIAVEGAVPVRRPEAV